MVVRDGDGLLADLEQQWVVLGQSESDEHISTHAPAISGFKGGQE